MTIAGGRRCAATDEVKMSGIGVSLVARGLRPVPAMAPAAGASLDDEARCRPSRPRGRPCRRDVLAAVAQNSWVWPSART